MKVMLLALLWSCLSAVSHAQEKNVHFSIELDKQEVLPGESAKVSVFATFDPGVGANIKYLYPGNGQVYDAAVKAYGGTSFDLAVNSATVGLFTNLSLNSKFNNNGYKEGLPFPNVVKYVTPEQLFSPKATDNPIFLWSADWTPQVYTHDIAEFSLENLKSVLMALSVWDPTFPGSPTETYFDKAWAHTTSGATLFVVPSPGAGVLLGMGVLLASRRRR